MKKMIVSLFLFCTSAMALDVQTFRPLNMSQGGFNLYDADSFRKNRFSLSLYYNFDKHPLEFGLQDTTKVDDIVNDLHTLNLLFSYEISSRVAINFDLPYQFLSDFEGLSNPIRSEEQSLGDLLLSLPIYLGRLGKRLNFKLIPKVVLNTGNNDPFVGSRDVLFGLGLAIDRKTKKSRWVFNAEYQAREKETLFNLTIGDKLKFGLGYNRDIGDPKGFIWINEITAEVPVGINQQEVNSPIEAFTGIRHLSENEKFIWNLGYSKGLNHGYGAPDYRLFAGLNYRFDRTKQSKSRKVLSPRSIPIKKTNAPKKKDAVKEKPFVTSKVVPPIVVELEKIHFLSNSDQIKRDSLSVVMRLVTLLRKYGGIEMLRIEGHTDSQGSDAYNLDLSRRRARSVKSRLIALGVEKTRLESTGFGPRKPIDTNLTKEGRYNNRRVEFKVIRATGPKIIFKLKQ